MAVFYGRLVSDDKEFLSQFDAVDYEAAMAYVNRVCIEFESALGIKFMAYVSPVPFDD